MPKSAKPTVTYVDNIIIIIIIIIIIRTRKPCYCRENARCRCKFRYVSNFSTASRGYPATARLHRRGNRGSSPPNKIIAGATSTSCSPKFFLQLTVKSNLTDCKVTFDTKILENCKCFVCFFLKHVNNLLV